MYPRLYRLGLIEATQLDAPRHRALGSIRGFIASASLKPGAGPHHYQPLVGIRGFIASASLKPACTILDTVTSAEYPRLYRLGLIEATPSVA